MALKQALIGAGFAAFRASRLHKALRVATRGQGAILTLHRVLPFKDPTPGYAPNRLLEITPEFLESALGLLRAQGFEIVTLEEAVARLGNAGGRPFVALTFDDGYRDVRDFAVPILERHGAPFTVFFATGMIERSARLWWLELEEAVRRLDRIEVDYRDFRLSLPARSAAEKTAAYERLYWSLRARPEVELLDVVAGLAESAGVTSAGIAEDLFMNWEEAKDFVRNPLVTAGAHTCSHLRLAQWPIETARAEMTTSKMRLEAEFARRIDALAYPVGDPTSAGPREFELAREVGFRCAVTTRPGMLFPEHAAHPTALPRVSLNGLWQDEAYLEVLLSGAPFALWNRGRRLNVA